MVRMSDLARGTIREAPPARPAEPPTAKRPPEPPAPEPADPVVAPPRERVRFAVLGGARDPAKRPREAPPTVGRPAEAPGAAPFGGGEEPAEPLFAELLGFVGGVRPLVKATEPFPWSELERLVGRAITALERSGDLFWVANNPAVPPGADYLAFHQARVAVLALRIGASVGYDRRRLLTLGMAGALIDVGLWQMPEGFLKRLDALTPDEQALYRSHPRLSADVVRRWSPPSDDIVEAILEHHEREHGQGFPQGLQADAVHPDAKILGLVDTYTGLTAPSAARARLRPHEAIREIVRTKHEAFPSSLIKALLSEISVFPPGTVVRLNSDEVGRVVAVNRNHPLRPRIEILSDSKGHRLQTPKTIDLSESPFLYVTGPVTESAR